MDKARIVLIGGLGYPITETAAGLPTLQNRLRSIGADTIIVTHTDSQPAYDFMVGFNGFKAYIGSSLGAGAAADFAKQLKDEVDFVGGFQPSNYDPLARWDPVTQLWYIQVPQNVKAAHVIRDPLWIQTFGLGNATYERVEGDRQPLLITTHEGAHPDDWGYSQDLIFNQVKGMIE